MRLALTFDDGPSQWTGAVLDLLARHNTKATFFLVGHNIAGREDLVKRAAAEGHEIGNHGWTHTRMTEQTEDEITDELNNTAELIAGILGARPTLWRTPYLLFSPQALRIGKALGMTHVGFDVDPGDWCGTVEGIVRTVTAAPDGSIIDLHDGMPPDGGSGHTDRTRTVEALAQILPALPDVEFVTVSELWA